MIFRAYNWERLVCMGAPSWPQEDYPLDPSYRKSTPLELREDLQGLVRRWEENALIYEGFKEDEVTPAIAQTAKVFRLCVKELRALLERH